MQGNLLERSGSERRALAAGARAARRLARAGGRVGEREAPVRDRGRPRRQSALLVRRRDAAHRSGHLRRLRPHAPPEALVAHQHSHYSRHAHLEARYLLDANAHE